MAELVLIINRPDDPEFCVLIGKGAEVTLLVVRDIINVALSLAVGTGPRIAIR